MGRAVDLWQTIYLRYVSASIVALAADVLLFLALQAGGMAAGGASAIGYCAGIVTHWII